MLVIDTLDERIGGAARTPSSLEVQPLRIEHGTKEV
jgi:hypothetical protein